MENGEVFGVMIQVNGEGTIVWKIEDYDRIIHPIKIKKALYVPQAQSCLIAPQQWEQQENDNYPKPDGTWYTTKALHCTQYWYQECYRHTITWYPS